MRSLKGTMWKAVAARSFDKEGHEVLPFGPFGPRPTGFAIFEAERMLVAIVDSRTELPPDSPPRLFLSYTGTYRFNGVELVTVADDASSPEAIVQQVRHVRFESDSRMVTTIVSGVSGLRGAEVIWERVGGASGTD